MRNACFHSFTVDLPLHLATSERERMKQKKKPTNKIKIIVYMSWQKFPSMRCSHFWRSFQTYNDVWFCHSFKSLWIHFCWFLFLLEKRLNYFGSRKKNERACSQCFFAWSIRIRREPIVILVNRLNKNRNEWRLTASQSIGRRNSQSLNLLITIGLH